MTEAIYLEVSEKTEAAKKAGRQVSVSGMLKFLGVSRSGYLAWLHHVPSDTEKRREAVKEKIQDIYDDSKQNYGAPKITVELRDSDFSTELSIRIVAANMLQRNIKKQPKICSVATRRKLFRGIMHALNPFILLSNVNGSTALKFTITSRHTA